MFFLVKIILIFFLSPARSSRCMRTSPFRVSSWNGSIIYFHISPFVKIFPQKHWWSRVRFSTLSDFGPWYPEVPFLIFISHVGGNIYRLETVEASFKQQGRVGRWTPRWIFYPEPTFYQGYKCWGSSHRAELASLSLVHHSYRELIGTSIKLKNNYAKQY